MNIVEIPKGSEPLRERGKAESNVEPRSGFKPGAVGLVTQCCTTRPLDYCALVNLRLIHNTGSKKSTVRSMPKIKILGFSHDVVLLGYLRVGEKVCPRGHSFCMYVKFSAKLTFLTP